MICEQCHCGRMAVLGVQDTPCPLGPSLFWLLLQNRPSPSSVVPSRFFGASYLLSRSFSEISFGSCSLHVQACLDRVSKPEQGGILFPLEPCADNLSCPSCVDLKGLTSGGQLDFQIPGMSPCRSIGTNYRADTSLGQNFREDLRHR